MVVNLHVRVSARRVWGMPMRGGFTQHACDGVAELHAGLSFFSHVSVTVHAVPKQVPAGVYEAQQHAASTLWHLASIPQNCALIAQEGVLPLVLMLNKAHGAATRDDAPRSARRAQCRADRFHRGSARCRSAYTSA